MMLLLSFIAGAAIGAVAVGLVQVGRQADLEDALTVLGAKWETRALRAGKEAPVIQEFMLDLEDLREGMTHETPA